MIYRAFALVSLLVILAGCGSPDRPPNAGRSRPARPSAAAPTSAQTAAPGAAGTVSSGSVSGADSGLLAGCAAGRPANFNPALVGTLSAGGSEWTVPAPVEAGRAAVDIYNDCTGAGANPDYASQLGTVVVDEDGAEITAYLFADNYFELYVNGAFVARDPIGFTPFNSSVVRFKARYPITYAVKLVDWESHLGLGMEYEQRKVGDGGFIAYFSDGSATSAAWRAETFYIAPLDNPGCVSIDGGRSSAGCPIRPACADANPEGCQALHVALPAGWTAPGFDDSGWPQAREWPADKVTNQPAYADNAELFGTASFIWTSNLHLDNLVLARHTVAAP
ncbi:MAG TPA: hypothetical protein VD886_17085 [Herpetosiphonaceae bacterium]|nr:hypothetical protein [Herpetosiphonaceae bacterium]